MKNEIRNTKNYSSFTNKFFIGTRDFHIAYIKVNIKERDMEIACPEIEKYWLY